MATNKKFSPKIEDEIFERIAIGERLMNILDEKHMPERGTFYWRLRNDADFAFRYDLARQERADFLFDEIVAIANGNPDAPDDSVSVQRDRLRVDARKWATGKLYPASYGDAQQIALNNLNREPIEQITRIVLVAEDKTLALPPPDADDRQAN